MANAEEFVKDIDRMKAFGVWDGRDTTYTRAKEKLKDIDNVNKELNKKEEVEEISENDIEITPVEAFTLCHYCDEEVEYTFDPLHKESNDITADRNGYVIQCPNCRNYIDVEPVEIDLALLKVDDVTKDGFFFEIMDKNTGRTCWLNAWKDEHGYWYFDYNQFDLALDNKHDIILYLFQKELKDYTEQIGSIVGEIADEIKSGKRQVKEHKVNETYLKKSKELREAKRLSEGKVSNMDEVDIIIQLESDDLVVEDIDDWNTIKAVAKKLSNSQGFYSRLYKAMEETDIDSIEFPILL